MVTLGSLELAINLVWVMMASFLVFFMHAGFTMVESGFTRAKNALNIIMKNFLTMSLGPLVYFFIGFGIMFGDSKAGLFGSKGFMLSGREDLDFFVFQVMFAATCATIISGAVAERIRLRNYVQIVILMVAIVYPVVGHWVWNGGWLAAMGFTDFAGSTVVHLTGATAAFISVLFLGPRIGKYTGKQVNVIPAHNMPLGAVGVFVLWLGWFGFNGGSTLAADPQLVPHVIAATLLSTSASLLAAGLYTKIRYGKIDPSLSLNGVLGGLVGITAGAAEISLGGSIIVGMFSGVILVIGVRFLETKVRVDDPVGAIAVHGICGIWGTLAIGLFSTSTGLFYGGGLIQLGVQALGVLAVSLWAMGIIGIALFIITRIAPIRVSEKEEISGLDFTEHGSNAYELKETLVEHGTQRREMIQIRSAQEKFGNGHLADRLNDLTSS